MKYMKKYFCMKLLFAVCVISFFESQKVIGQGLNDDYQYYVPSPQTSDFMKYGNLPVNHYTGNLNLKIPIYHYKDKDFDLDLSLKYNSSGFVPNKRSGIVGLNWFLNAGGLLHGK